MKHKFSGIIMVGIVIVSMFFSSAAYAQDKDLPSPGITPDSPFYFFEKLGKSIGMAFTFGSEARARKALQYAEERLAEVQSMAAKNKIKEMERAAGDYNQYMARVQERLEETRRQGQSANISERVALATAKHLGVLERVREQVPEKAKIAIAHAENVSMNGQVNALRALAKVKPERAFDICDNVTLRQMEKFRIRITDNVTAVNVTRELDYAVRIADLEDEIADIAEATGANVTAIQQRLAHSTANRLDVLSGVYEKVPEKAQPAIANAIENSVKKYEKVVDKLTDKNITGAVSVNETINKVIPEKLREKVQISVSNKAPAAITNSGNATFRVLINTEKPVPNKDQAVNKESPKPVIATANQTREPEKTLKSASNK